MSDAQPLLRCPICNGTGQIEPPANQYDEQAAKRIMARALRDHGYSFREIMRLCGWKSPRSAALACASNLNTGESDG
jgi:hypothetical protein